jgi:hypothetical protein
MITLEINIYRKIILKRILNKYILCMRWAGHVARMGEKRNAYRILVGKPEGKRDHWEDQDVDGWTILKWILER